MQSDHRKALTMRCAAAMIWTDMASSEMWKVPEPSSDGTRSAVSRPTSAASSRQYSAAAWEWKPRALSGAFEGAI